MEKQKTREEIRNAIGRVVSDAEGMGYLDPKQGLNMLVRLADIVDPVVDERDRLGAGLAQVMKKWFETAFDGLSLRAFMQGISEDLWGLAHGEPRVEATGSGERRFHLQRDTDVTGVSGSGRVCEGVVFSDGTGAMRWLSSTPFTVMFSDISHVDTVHGHDGATRVVWDD